MHAPDDILEIFLGPGEFYFGEGKTRIRTLLGSCVAIPVRWDRPLQASLPMIHPYMAVRALSGAMIVASGIIQAWNVYKTMTVGERVLGLAPAAAEAPA